MDNNKELCSEKPKEEKVVSEEKSGENEKVDPPEPTVDTEAAAKPELSTKVKKTVKFNDVVLVELAEDYDRLGSLTVRLTSMQKFEISRELNEYKRNEMEVHEESHGNTRYHSLL